VVTDAARLPPPGLPGLDPDWSRLVPVVDGDGHRHTWHVLDTAVAEPDVTVLCLHGNPTWSYLWRRLLAAAPPTWRVVAPDLLGMGYSERLTRPRTLAQHVTDVSALTQALGVTGPVVTVAHDWGGPVSIGWAAQHPDQLRGVVLSNTAVHMPAGTAGPAVIRLTAAQPAVRDTICARTPTFVRATTALSRPALPREVRNAFAAPYHSTHRRRGVAGFVADVPFSADHPTHPEVERIAAATSALDVPTLLLWGPRDPVFGEHFLNDLLQRVPHAQLHRYEGASHLVLEDAPQYTDAVTGWVGDLLADQPGPPQPRQERSSSVGSRLLKQGAQRESAVVDVGRRAVSWKLLNQRVSEVAAGLSSVGVRPGDRVALLVPPSVDLTAAVYAVWRAGAVIVVADKGLGVQGMGRALRGARVDHVIATAAGLAAARAMRLPGTRIAAGPAPRALTRALGAQHSLANLARLGAGAPAPAGASVDDECAVVFTSGATGAAKGVVYRHRQLESQVELIRSTYRLGPDDRIVAAFAPFALYGPALGIGSAVPRMDVTAPQTLTAAALADAVSAIAATVVFASPAALRNVLATSDQLAASQRTALAGVRLLMSAGAPVPVGLLRSLQALLPAAELHTPYGMTEVLPVTDISLPEIEAAGRGNGVCVGHALPGVDVAVSPLSSSGAAEGPLMTEAEVTGELCVRADHVKDRYDALWATQRQSARTPGWHRTGDVGHRDAEARWWVEGRLVHILTTAAGVVTPVGIEQRVEELPEVRSAAVVGVGPAGTQQVVVVVVLDEDNPGEASQSAPQPVTDLVRSVAGVDVAAVLARRSLPVDIRHASKIDRVALADWATAVLGGIDSH
jgi:acyl-coenzyme A synthetase/AMP-(fatty) acid ligase/pimeloyl-ACP methyl ester carboxylesterase